jgi:hypothetical protein
MLLGYPLLLNNDYSVRPPRSLAGAFLTRVKPAGLTRIKPAGQDHGIRGGSGHRGAPARPAAARPGLRGPRPPAGAAASTSRTDPAAPAPSGTAQLGSVRGPPTASSLQQAAMPARVTSAASPGGPCMTSSAVRTWRPPPSGPRRCARPAPPPARAPRSPRSPRDSSAAGRRRGIRGPGRGATYWILGGLAWRGPQATNAYRTPGRCSAGRMSGNYGPRESKVPQVISVARETEYWLPHAWAGGRGG